MQAKWTPPKTAGRYGSKRHQALTVSRLLFGGRLRWSGEGLPRFRKREAERRWCKRSGEQVRDDSFRVNDRAMGQLELSCSSCSRGKQLQGCARSRPFQIALLLL